MSFLLGCLNHTAIRGLQGLWKLNELSGTTAVDSSGLGNNGTYTGTGFTQGQASIIPSGTGKSLQITGNGYVALPTAIYNTTSRPITIFGWGKSSNVTPVQMIIASSAGGFGFYLNAGNMVGGVLTVSTNITDARTMVAGNIYFWALTIGSTGDAYIYVNGVASSVATAAFSSSIKFVDTIAIGNYVPSPTNNWFNGYLQNVGICNVELTAIEINNIYATS